MSRHFHLLAAAFTLTAAAATLPAHAGSFVLAYTDGQVDTSYTNLQQFAANIGGVALGSTYAMSANGSVSSAGMTTTTRSIITFAKSRGLPLFANVSDYNDAAGGFDAAVSNGVLATATSRSKAVTNLVNLATSNGFAGIDADFEAVQPANKANYTAFLSSLASALHVYGLKLIVSVPAKTSDAGASYLDGYDYAGMGSVVDFLQVMTYDEVGPGWSSDSANGNTWPGPESGLDWQRQVLSYTVSRVPASKVLSGLPAYGYDFSTGQPVHWSDFQAVVASHAGARLGRDSASATPWASWGTVTQQPDGTAWSTRTGQPMLWYDDAASVQAKVSLVSSMGLGGTSVWAMGYEDASFWSAVKSSLQPAPATALVINAAANAGGSIAPSGAVSVAQGGSQTFSIQPSAGYNIASVTVDGQPAGAVSAYTFTNVQAQHTISASFAALSTGDGNIERSGTGYVWTQNTSATSNAHRSARAALNDGVLTSGSPLNPSGEDGLVRWEGAGIVWASPRTVTGVRFVNGAIDGYGNGYFQGGVRLQFTTDGQTWADAGWTLSPAYPGTPAAAGAAFTFSGAARSGVRGARVVGTTGSDS
jgi:spore germination protein YaaH